jgi:hypothetical protein
MAKGVRVRGAPLRCDDDDCYYLLLLVFFRRSKESVSERERERERENEKADAHVCCSIIRLDAVKFDHA